MPAGPELRLFIDQNVYKLQQKYDDQEGPVYIYVVQ